MKSKLFKKLIAGAATLAMVAQFGFVLPASAAENGITYDYGNKTINITYNEAKNAKLIVAKYKEDKTLQSVTAENVSLDNGTKNVTKTLNEGDVVMIWDSLEAMQPLMDSFTTPADPKKVILDEKFTSDTVSNPADNSYTWGDISSLLSSKKGLLLTNANSTGNNYENKDIVAFTNPIGDTGTKVDISYNVAYQDQSKKSKGQEYSNFTLSYYNENDKFMFSITESIGFWNDKAVIEYADSESTTAKEEVAKHIEKSVNAEVKFGNGCGYLTVDGKMYRFVTNGTLNKIKATVSGGQDFNRGIYITNYKLTTEPTVLEEYCLVTYNVEGEVSTDSVVSGNTVTASKVPSTDRDGYIFDGWQMNNDESKLYTTEEVKAMKITTDVVFTAKYHINSEYVQSIASVQFIDKNGAVVESKSVKAMSYPTEADTVSYEPYEIKVTSDIGNDITDDCTITWTAVGGGGIDAGYFQFVEKKDEDSADTVVSSKRYARLRQGGESWFGYIKADVTYNPSNSDDETKKTTGSAQIPCAAVNGGKAANQIIPAAGYPESMDYYVDELLGYQCTSGIYTDGYDPVLNNWSITGSNGTRDLLLVKEGDKKAIKITNTGGPWGPAGNSTLGVYAFPAQTAQYVLETVIMFEGDGARLGVWDKTPNNANPSAEWSVSYSGGAINVGDAKISGVDAKTWYKLVITSDPTNDIYSVYVYDMEGNLVGTPVEGAQGTNTTPKFLCVDGGFPVYINSLKAYTPSVDSVQITSDTDVVRVPENDTDVEQVSLSANCKTADGIKLTGAVDWSLAQEYQGVTLEKGVQTAVLKVQKGAAGTVQVNATMGGKSATKTITLTNSSNVVSFKQSKTSITIPFENEENATAVFKADTITSESPEGINDTSITYSFLDKTGAAELTTLPSGITRNVTDGMLTLTVAPGATPAVFYVKATNSEGLSTKTQVNVHGLSYQFGTTVEEGYTQVTAATLYNETLGYGFETTTGLTDAKTSISGTAAYKFKANVPNGNYKITVNTTSASMKSEIVDSLVSSSVKGVTKSGNEFNVAVCDGVLDLTFDANSTISLLSIAQIAKPEKRENPKVYAIGDSTTQNSNGGNLSWGSHIANGSVEIPAAFSGFSNNGKSGADSVSFYNGGLIEAVLLDIHPGDYVSVNMGINHDRDGANECAAFVPLLSKYYIEAIQERGGIPVITTSTPIGYNADPNKGWVESNGKIICNRGTGAHNGDLRKLAKQYNLNIIELGYYFESYFNDEIQIDGQKISDEAATAGTTALELAKSWYGDHNHYKQPLADKIAKYMLNCFAQIEGGSDAFNQANDPHITEQ